MGTEPMKWVEGHHSVALASDAHPFTHITSFTTNADTVPEALREAQWRKTDGYVFMTQFLLPLFLPGEPHGQRSPASYSPWGHKESDTVEQLTLPCF